MEPSEGRPGTEEAVGGAGDRSRGAGPARPAVEQDALTRRVRSAHGDAWQAHGRLRATSGGGAEEWAGIRLMASGIAVPQWNNGDVTDPHEVDIDAVRAWYADRGVPWGVRVADDVRLPADPAGLDVSVAGPDDIEDYVRVDAAAFGEDDTGETRMWTRPLVGAAGFRLLLARLEGEPVGVLATARRRGVGAALVADAVRWGLGAGANLAWLNPDPEAAVRLYSRLGFEETGGFDVYVDN